MTKKQKNKEAQSENPPDASVDVLVSESDVEQKFLFSLLTTGMPNGLGIASASIVTKHNLRRLSIGKGSAKKSYFPDYAVIFGSLPLMIVEAKAPHEDLIEAFGEARLYAAELNALFPHAINPVSRLMVSDGLRLLAGNADEAEPTYTLDREEVAVYSEKWALVQSFIGTKALSAEYQRLSKLLRPKTLKKPRKLVGGQTIQQMEIEHNTFGATISADFSHIFNPVTREDRARIARDAYVASKRRDRYIEPIDRVVRASLSAHATHQLISDTEAPREIIKPLRKGKELEHQVMLIIGDVGSGKSTFIDHLQEVALPKEVRASTVWLHIDMNVAPVSANAIYDWLYREIVDGCQATMPDLDFDDLDVMKRVYSVEVNKFTKGRGKLFAGHQFNQELSARLEQLENNLHDQAISHTRFCSTERGKLLIIVLDNCGIM